MNTDQSNLKKSKVESEAPKQPKKPHLSSSSNKPEADRTEREDADKLRPASSFKSKITNETGEKSAQESRTEPPNRRYLKSQEQKNPPDVLDRKGSLTTRNHSLPQAEPSDEAKLQPRAKTIAPKEVQVRKDSFKPRTFENYLVLDSELAFEPNPCTLESLRSESKQVHTSAKHRESTRQRARLKVRWRLNEEGKIQSNARFVKWSDGTFGIFVGESYFDLTDKTVPQQSSLDTSHIENDQPTRAKPPTKPPVETLIEHVTHRVADHMLLSVGKVKHQLVLDAKNEFYEVRQPKQPTSKMLPERARVAQSAHKQPTTRGEPQKNSG